MNSEEIKSDEEKLKLSKSGKNPKPTPNEKIITYHSFQHRDGYLDVLFEKSKINQSEFKGFFNMVMSLLILYVFTLPVYNYLNFGYFIKTKAFNKMIDDLSILVLVWPVFHFWTYLAYVLQIMILRGYNKLFCLVFQNVTQIGIFIVTTYICLYSDMCTSHVVFTLVQCIIHFFKMLSYTQVNRDYREDYLSKLKTGEKQLSTYPKNINFENFFYFLKAPTFVYEESYPRSESFRPMYFILKVLKAFFNLTLMYYIYTEHIEVTIPIMLTSSILELVIRLYFPICLWSFCAFYLLFECVLPAYAELATFGDRQFYDDWWNSTDLEEFNRRWNKIVHQFLYRHVYLECNKKWQLSSSTSKLITFLFSAVLHEYCLCVIIKLFRPYMFIMMMMQMPLMIFGKKYFKNTTKGNYFFWFSILIGNCLIFVAYNRAYLLEYGHLY